MQGSSSMGGNNASGNRFHSGSGGGPQFNASSSYQPQYSGQNGGRPGGQDAHQFLGTSSSNMGMP